MRDEPVGDVVRPEMGERLRPYRCNLVVQCPPAAATRECAVAGQADDEDVQATGAAGLELVMQVEPVLPQEVGLEQAPVLF